ncbi:MAG: HAD-IIIA family hydrolase [Akkermansiaceae bacterium]|nr:HAD-IIIA family hydrolase [Akkermansiaceae bacterium]
MKLPEIPLAILAGGLATRLRPLTEKIPKALVEVAGKPFIDWQLELLSTRGIGRVVVCAGHLGEMIEEHVGDGSRFGMQVSYANDGKTLLGTGGAIRKALDLLGDVFFVLYGDSYLPIDYRAVAHAFFEKPMSGLMTVYPNQGLWDASNVWMEGDRVRLYDKAAKLPQMQHIDYGLSLYRREAFLRHPPGENFDLSQLMKDLVAREEMAAFQVDQRFYEIGSIEGIADLERYLTRSKRAVFFDRDGILNEIIMRGSVVGSPRAVSEFRIKEGAKELMQAAHNFGFACIVVTNQPDLQRGLLCQSELDEMHRVLASELSPDAIEVCPMGSAEDRRKKPNPGMIFDAAEEHGIDLASSWLVGDSAKDIEAGKRSGLGTILLATDYNQGVEETADFFFSSLAEIAAFLSNANKSTSR